jgi:hypothetical protein
VSAILAGVEVVDDPGCKTDLVKKALCSTLSNCCEWESVKVQRLVINNPGNRGLQLPEIKKLAQGWARNDGKINCTKETDKDWIEKTDFYYWIRVPVDDIPNGLFIKMLLINEDLEYPVVALVGAHPSTKR